MNKKKTAAPPKSKVFTPQGMIPKVYDYRRSYTGQSVCFLRVKGRWEIQNGRYEQADFIGRKVNVLCHDNDPPLPKNFDYEWHFTGKRSIKHGLVFSDESVELWKFNEFQYFVARSELDRMKDPIYRVSCDEFLQESWLLSYRNLRFFN